VTPSAGTRPLLDSSFVAGHRRRRYEKAVAEACADRGFGRITVTEIVARAHTSRNAFYEQFGNRDEAFVSAVGRGLEEAFAAVERGCAQVEEPEARLEAGLGALLGWIAMQPEIAWVCLVESFALPDTFSRYLAAQLRFAEMLRGALPRQLPPGTDEALVGGVAAILSSEVRAGRTAQVPELLPNLLLFLRGPALA
jgi:AcrR family transcriptional regulator